MRKNGSRLISFKQYRTTDLFLFAVIYIAFELIVHFAFASFQSMYVFSPLVPIVLLVMMRWGWPSAFYAVGGGVLYCLLNMNTEGFQGNHFAVYIIGNAFIMLLLLMIKFVGKEKIAGKWYLSLLFVAAGWLSVVIGRTLVAVCFGYNFVGTLLSQLSDLFSLGISAVLILCLRRLDGMFEDQKTFLLRLDKERKELAKQDEFGAGYDGYTEIDEESLSVLKRDNDLYE